MHAAGAPPVTASPSKWPYESKEVFKDWHYLEKDWRRYFDDGTESFTGKVVLEVGRGAGNTIFPLIATFPKLYIHECDFSPKAITLVKSHANYNAEKMNVFVCDAAKDDLCVTVMPFTVDIVTLTSEGSVLENCKQVLKPNGHIILRDYAVGDSAQVKLRSQMISENFYFLGDGTCSFYFSETYTSTLFQNVGFAIVDINTYCKEIMNHSRNINMQRRWIRGIVVRS
ncbi:unnamed protein product [Withania somnifera]